MRMITVNIINTIKVINLTKPKKYFCVSTDKATYPINMMGASKAIMEKFLFREMGPKVQKTSNFFLNIKSFIFNNCQ